MQSLCENFFEQMSFKVSRKLSSDLHWFSQTKQSLRFQLCPKRETQLQGEYSFTILQNQFSFQSLLHTFQAKRSTLNPQAYCHFVQGEVLITSRFHDLHVSKCFWILKFGDSPSAVAKLCQKAWGLTLHKRNEIGDQLQRVSGCGLDNRFTFKS